MDSALSEAPFFPEDFTLPQLPFFSEDRVDDLPLPATPSSICKHCWQGPFSRPRPLGLLWLWSRDGHRRRCNEIKYWTSPARLISGAEAGCVWCRFILQIPDEHWQFYINEGLMITLRGNPAKTWDEEPEFNQRYQRIDVDINEHTMFRGFMYTYLGDPAAAYIEVRDPAPDPTSPRVMALAREKIEACVRGHRRCQSLSLAFPGPRLPTRLVDCTDLAQPRLVTIPSTEHGEYLALSYVWGEDQVHKTTTFNESTYKRGIALSILPATILDAIRVTHMLGFQWLWVDSLCIIQDSDEDKMHELSHMHRIYRGAHVTIVAASAERVSEGFLQNRPPPEDGVALPFICRPHPLISQAKYRDDHSEGQLQVGQVYLSPRQALEPRTYRSLFGCMATRAWCMQEYLLSPRCLIFSPQGLRLRCCQVMRSIGGSSWDRAFIRDNIQLPDTLLLPVPPAADHNSGKWETLNGVWGVIVGNYSNRTAKEESDKLVACAAVAAHFHRVLRCDYLAGLWRSDTLLVDLLWSARGCTRPTTYRAPSWSWAALEGSIKWGFPLSQDFAMLAKVVQCWVTLEDPGLSFGRVTGGALVLYGVLIPCCGELAERDGHFSRWFVPLPRYEKRYQGSRDSPTSEPEGEGERHTTNPVSIARVTVTMDCDADELPRSIWIVPFVGYKQFRSEDQVNGMVLELTRPEVISDFSDEKALYRRIGKFCAELPSRSVPIRIEGSSTEILWDPLTWAREVREGFFEDSSYKCIEIV